MGEVVFTYRYLGNNNPVRDGRIDEQIPTQVIQKVLKLEKVMIFDEAASRYMNLRLDEHAICHDNIETGWSEQTFQEVNKIRKEITEIEEQKPEIEEQFTDFLNSALSIYI